MSKTLVEGILRKIDALPDDDRVALERELTRRFAREWKQQVTKARTIAKSRKINQQQIDRAIERHRYGK